MLLTARAALGPTAALLLAVAVPAHAHADADVGLMTDVGVPDGATASLVAHPVRAIRLEAGIGYNGVAAGARGGITWVPLSSWVTPTLGVGYGYFPERDATTFAREVSGDSTLSSPLLDHVGYDFAVARAGLEFGKRWVTFFVHAGVTRVTGELHGVDAAASAAVTASGGTTVTVSSSDPSVTAWTVSADVGLIFHVL